MTLLNSLKQCHLKCHTRLLLWTLAWTISLLVVDKAHLYGWLTSDWLSMAGVLLNAALGVGVVLVFLKYLRGIDEMQRKIQLDSLALAVGVGFVGGFSYTLLETTGFITDPEVSDLIVIMCVAYMGSVIAGHIRYR